MPEERSVANVLLEKAQGDLYAAACLAKDGGAPAATIGYHAQQAVEKSIKAVLAQKGLRFPYTHDLAALLQLAQQEGVVLPPDSEWLPYLTAFATTVRYQDEDSEIPATMDMAALISWAEHTVAWAAPMIEPASPPNAS